MQLRLATQRTGVKPSKDGQVEEDAPRRHPTGLGAELASVEGKENGGETIITAGKRR